jgi:nucleoside-diphosphate-sugar epimerase
MNDVGKMSTSLNLSGRRVFVTGASGFIGRPLVTALAGAGAEVHALRHLRRIDSRATAVPASSGVVWHDADVLDCGSLSAALEAASPDTVCHLAAYGARPGEVDVDRMLAVNVEACANLWRSIPQSVQRLILAGTSREYARATRPVTEHDPCGPHSIYPASKHAGITLLNALAAQTGRETTVLRIFGAYGPGDTSDRVVPFTIARLLADDVVPLTSASQHYDFVFLDDVVRGFLLAACAPRAEGNRTYNIGSGVAHQLRDVIEQIAEIVGGRAHRRLRFAARPNDDEGAVVCADLTAARHDLGFEAAVPLRVGLAATVQWWRASGCGALKGGC